MQNFSAIAALLLAHNTLTTEDIAACVRSDQPPLAYARDTQGFWQQIYQALSKRKEGLTRDFLEVLQSISYQPIETLGNWAAHDLATLLNFCALCAGNCILQQPRAYVPEDAWQYNCVLELLELLKTKVGDKEELTAFVDKFIPLDSLVTSKVKGDGIFLSETERNSTKAFQFGARLRAIEHPEEQILTQVSHPAYLDRYEIH